MLLTQYWFQPLKFCKWSLNKPLSQIITHAIFVLSWVRPYKHVLFLWPSLVNRKRDYGVMKWSIGCVRLLYYGFWYKRPKDWTQYYLCQVSSISVLSARVFLCVCLPVWGSVCVLYRSADSSINLWLLLITSLHLSLSHFIYRSTHLSLSLLVFCQFHSLSPLFALFSSCYILLGSFKIFVSILSSYITSITVLLYFSYEFLL